MDRARKGIVTDHANGAWPYSSSHGKKWSETAAKPNPAEVQRYDRLAEAAGRAKRPLEAGSRFATGKMAPPKAPRHEVAGGGAPSVPQALSSVPFYRSIWVIALRKGSSESRIRPR
jgi:hypothetical protein